MSDYWKIVTPVKRVNHVLNPVFGSTNGYALGGSATVSRSTVKQFFGQYALKLDTTGTGDYVTLDCAGVGGSQHKYISFFADYHSAGMNVNVNSTDYSPQSYTQVDDTWYHIVFYIDSNTTFTDFEIHPERSGSQTTYIDGVQVEDDDGNQSGHTSFLYGDMSGAYHWLGERHNSQSIRGQFEPSGGYEKQLETDLGFCIEYNTGVALAPVDVLTDNTPGVDGSAFNGVEVRERSFELRGRMSSTSLTDFHNKRSALAKAVHSLNGGPRRLKYEGAPTNKYIDGFYDAGLEGSQTNMVSHEDMDLRFVATDPYFYREGEGAASGDGNQTVTPTGNFTARIGGDWTALTQPSSVGGNADALALVYNDGRVYIGGDFLNWDGASDADYFTWYDIATDTYADNTDLPTNPGTGIIYKMLLDNSGNVIVCGANGVFAFDGSSWDATILGSPSPNANGAVYDGLIAKDGTWWFVGAFTSIDGVTSPGVVNFDGASTYSTPGTISGNYTIYSVEEADNGSLYFVPDEVSSLYTIDSNNGMLFVYNGGAWDALPSSTNGYLSGLARVNWVKCIGNFAAICVSFSTTTCFVYLTPIGTDFTNYQQVGLAAYGSASSTTGSATNSNGVARVIDNQLLICNVKRIAKTDFSDGTLDYFTTDANDLWLPIPYDIYSADAESYQRGWPVPPENTSPSSRGDVIKVGDDIYIAQGSIQDTAHPETITIDYEGTAPTYPMIEITPSGATAEDLNAIENITNGAGIFFNNFEIAADEVITVRTAPDNFGVESSTRGDITNEIVGPSDLQAFRLVPSQSSDTQENIIEVFGGDLNVLITYPIAYLGQD